MFWQLDNHKGPLFSISRLASIFGCWRVSDRAAGQLGNGAISYKYSVNVPNQPNPCGFCWLGRINT